MRYAIVIEKAQSNYSAYVPDLPGCVATGATVEEVESQIREAIEFHLEGLREDGLPPPHPRAVLSTSISRHNRATERIAPKRADARFFAPVHRGR
jgi:predicted RNase H-like HicB family nuclease